MTKKEIVVPEQPESPEETDASSTPEVSEPTNPPEPVQKASISDTLEKIYNDAPQGTTWTLPQLTQLTGADEHSVCIAWHRLFDLKKVADTGFVKP